MGIEIKKLVYWNGNPGNACSEYQNNDVENAGDQYIGKKIAYNSEYAGDEYRSRAIGMELKITPSSGNKITSFTIGTNFQGNVNSDEGSYDENNVTATAGLYKRSLFFNNNETRYSYVVPWGGNNQNQSEPIKIVDINRNLGWYPLLKAEGFPYKYYTKYHPIIFEFKNLDITEEGIYTIFFTSSATDISMGAPTLGGSVSYNYNGLDLRGIYDYDGNMDPNDKINGYQVVSGNSPDKEDLEKFIALAGLTETNPDGTSNLISQNFIVPVEAINEEPVITTVTITLNPNGGSWSNIPTGWTKSGNNIYKVFNAGDALTLPSNPIREGYNFSSWSNVPSTVPNQNTTYTASWNAASYTVTLNKNGGSGGTNSVTATYSQAMPSATAPTRSYTVSFDTKEATSTTPASISCNYIFNGYYDTSATTGGNQYYNNNMSSTRTWDKTSNSILYARWTAGSITLPAKPTKPGYKFKGWTDGRTTYNSGASYTPTSDITLWALWEADGLAHIYTPEGWKTVQVYVYHINTGSNDSVSTGWHQVIPYVFKDGSWHLTQ